VVSGKESTYLTALVLLVAVSSVSTASAGSYEQGLGAMGEVEFLRPSAVLIDSLHAGTETLHPHGAVFVVSIGLLCISFLVDCRIVSSALQSRLRPGQGTFNLRGKFALYKNPEFVRQEQPLRRFRQKYIRNRIPEFTELHFSSFSTQALIYVAPRAEQKVSFSPGFIFVRLARGPPIFT
jgi:hypothetical protein